MQATVQVSALVWRLGAYVVSVIVKATPKAIGVIDLALFKCLPRSAIWLVRYSQGDS